jgi:hypothetical protein
MLNNAGFAVSRFEHCAYRGSSWPGRFLSVLEKAVPSLATDCAFLCESTEAAPNRQR